MKERIMVYSIKKLVTVAAVFMAVSLSRAENTDVMDLVRSNYTPHSNIELQFEHTIYWSVRERQEKKKGALLLAPGEKFRFTLGKDAVVSDGVTYWQYSDMNDQLIIYNLAEIDLSYHPSNLFANYLIERSFASAGAQEGMVVMESTAPDDRYSSIQIKVEESTGIIKQLTIVDKNENINTYTFTKTVLGKSFAPTDFIFTAPENIDILDMREGYAPH